jgi:hypothetical protein
MAIYVFDSTGKKRAWAGAEDDVSLSKLGLSKTAPITKSSSKDSIVNKTPTDRTSFLRKYEPRGSGYMVTDAKGKNTTISKKAIGEYGIENYIDENGNLIDRENRPSNAGRRYKEDDGDRTRKPIANNKTNTLYAGGSSNFDESTGSNNKSSSILSEINKAKNARTSSRKAALQGLRDKTLSSLAGERTGVKQQYYDEKNNESSSAQLRAKKIGELMASKGYSEGSQAQNELTANVGLQGTLGGLKRQEQSAYDDITRRGTDAETEYQTGLTQADSDAEIAAIEQRLAELGKQRDYKRQDEQTDYSRERDALSDERYNQERTDVEEAETYNRGQSENETKYNRQRQEQEDFVNTIEQYDGDYQAEINNIVNDGDTSNDWKLPYLKQARSKKIQRQLEQGQKTADATWTNAYKAWLQLSSGATDEMARILGIPKGTKAKDVIKTDYDIGKPYSGGGSGGDSTPITPPTWD